MPRPTQKAAKAKLQRKNAKNTFTSPQYDSDSSSAYNPSEDEAYSCILVFFIAVGTYVCAI